MGQGQRCCSLLMCRVLATSGESRSSLNKHLLFPELSVNLQFSQQEKKVKGSHRLWLWENHTRPSLLRTVPTSWRYWASG